MKTTLVTAADLERMLYAAMRGGRLPDAFLYADEHCAREWLALDRSSSFTVAQRLSDLLLREEALLRRHCSWCEHLFGLGVGDAAKERFLCEKLNITNATVFDVGEAFVDHGMQVLAQQCRRVDGIVGMFEHLAPHLRTWRGPGLVTMLGNTFCNYDAPQLLCVLASITEPDDRVLIDAHLVDESADTDILRRIEQTYRSRQNARFNLAPLTRRGLAPQAARFSLHLRKTTTPGGAAWRTHKTITIERDSVIRCGGDSLKLTTGATLEGGCTYLYPLRTLRLLIEQNGFAISAECLSEDADNVLLVLRRYQTKETPS
ncbi:MAG: hypothetical protein GF331_07505 [Chitinivibrionales bacterium]|nr:hypothetical protein [Chitinivibrionales bacterium]